MGYQDMSDSFTEQKDTSVPQRLSLGQGDHFHFKDQERKRNRKYLYPSFTQK